MVENEARGREPAQVKPSRTDFTNYASYEDGDSLVVCDRTTPTAWIKSDVSTTVED